MTWLEDLRLAGVADTASRLGYRVSSTSPPMVSPCPACGADVRSTGANSGRPDRRLPVRVSRDGLLWHCHAGACKAGGNAITFACWALVGEAPLPRGDARWSAVRDGLGAVPVPPRPRAPAAPHDTAPRWPPQAEVRALWNAARPLTDDADAVRWASDRPGLNLDRLELLDAVRVLPESAGCPDWARCGGMAWSDSGHRLLLPLVDATGSMRSLRARQISSGTNKELAPTGHEVSGLVAACPLARGLFGAAERELIAACDRARANGVVVVEGTPAFWGWVSAFSDADEDAPAVVGIASGGWRQAHADAVAAAGVPTAVRVLLDVDPDPGGDRLADQVIPTLENHIRAGRVRLERRERSG